MPRRTGNGLKKRDPSWALRGSNPRPSPYKGGADLLVSGLSRRFGVPPEYASLPLRTSALLREELRKRRVRQRWFSGRVIPELRFASLLKEASRVARAAPNRSSIRARRATPDRAPREGERNTATPFPPPASLLYP